MLLEMHCHTSRYSRCSQIAPANLVRQVKKKELQGIVITEHHYLWKGDELEALRVEAELDKNFLILSGQEVVTDIGAGPEAVAAWVNARGTPLARIREAVEGIAASDLTVSRATVAASLLGDLVRAT